MENKIILKKQILYRSKHRGTKEMDLLLGNFVSKYINLFDDKELKELKCLLDIDDEILYKWYSNQSDESSVPNTRVSKEFKKFKL